MKVKNIPLLFLITLSFYGCSTRSAMQSSQQIKIDKGTPVVHIHPMNHEAYSKASVGVLPFSLPPNMNEEMGAGIAALFKEVLLGKRIYPKVKTIDMQYNNNEQAMAIGKEAGTDLVLAGKINYAIESTELGGARLDISIRMLNVNTKQTVWHINQAMDQPMAYPKTDILNFMLTSTLPQQIRRPMGAPAMTNMLAQSAVDMADVLGGARYVRR